VVPPKSTEPIAEAHVPHAASLNCRGRVLDLRQPRIMGVINVTPDSFSDGGRLLGDGPDLHRITDIARSMLADGAALLDVGGESTRPGAVDVTVDEELRRIIPVVERLVELGAVVSVDTSKSEVAERALAAGAHLINDVTGGRDAAMLDMVATDGAAFCVMHMQGTPRTMQTAPSYRDVVAEVGEYLVERVKACRRAGIAGDRLVIDPGFGFGKTLEHNLALLRNLSRLRIDGVAMLVGMSRKSMIGAVTGRPVESRAVGSAAAALLAVQRGADIVRVHDVAATADALRMLAAIEGAASQEQE
jgi:dihydropteroate synthase